MLPFADMSPEKDQDYFCEGMAEEIINALTKLEGLKVASRTSAFQFKGQSQDIRRIGEVLNVKIVLEGSVRTAGRRLRVTTQLINIADGYHLWSERYDREMDDVFAVQDEIARHVVETLKVRLVGNGDACLVKGQTHNLEAYRAYLEGRHHWNKLTEKGLEQTLRCFTEALRQEPSYAQAHAGIAMTHASRAMMSWAAPRDAMPKAKQAARESLALDDAVSDAHTALGFVLHTYEWDWDGAESEYRRALELNPGDTLARALLSMLLACVGRREEAVVEARSNLDLDPIPVFSNHALALAFLYARRFDEAVAHSRKMIDLDAGYPWAHWDLGMALAATDKLDEATAALEQGLVCAPGDPTMAGSLAWVHAHAGRRAKAVPILEQLKKRSNERYFSGFWLAAAYGELAELDEANSWLERSYAERDGLLIASSAIFVLDPLRSDPRFQALLRRMNFPETAEPTR